MSSQSVNSKRVAGVVYLKLNGEQVAARGSFAYKLSLEKKEAGANLDGSMYITGKMSLGYIKGTISNYNHTDVKEISNGEQENIILELSNGKVISAMNAVQVGDMEVNVETGEISVEWHSDKVEEVK